MYILYAAFILPVLAIALALVAWKLHRFKFVMRIGIISWVVTYGICVLFFSIMAFSMSAYQAGRTHYMTCSKVVDNDACTLREFFMSPVHWIFFSIVSISGLVIGAIVGLIIVYARPKNS